MPIKTDPFAVARVFESDKSSACLTCGGATKLYLQQWPPPNFECGGDSRLVIYCLSCGYHCDIGVYNGDCDEGESRSSGGDRQYACTLHFEARAGGAVTRHLCCCDDPDATLAELQREYDITWAYLACRDGKGDRVLLGTPPAARELTTRKITHNPSAMRAPYGDHNFSKMKKGEFVSLKAVNYLSFDREAESEDEVAAAVANGDDNYDLQDERERSTFLDRDQRRYSTLDLPESAVIFNPWNGLWQSESEHREFLDKNPLL